MKLNKYLSNLVLLGCLIAATFSHADISYGKIHDLLLPKFERGSDYGTSQHPLINSHGRWLVISFFEQDCRWCLKQMRSFNELNIDYSAQVDFIAAGIGDDRFQLYRWALRAEPDFPVVLATPELTRFVGEIPATPYSLLFSPQGEFITKVRGFVPHTKWRKVFEQLM